MSYDFKPLNWTHNTNIYEVNIRQYTKEGSFKAFGKELPRLKDMGVKTLWFMPITPIAQKNKKGVLGSYYAASDYISINPEFGTLDDFRILVKDAHELGFKVIIDWVANHTGWDHKWTTEHPDYYKKDPATGDFQIASGMDDIIELNFHNQELVKAMIGAMKFWIEECDIDGFRCDLAFWVELEFWKEARKELDAVKPLFWLGELDPIEHPEYMGTFDAAYTWTWMHKTEDFYKKNLSLDVLDTVLKEYDAIGDSSMRTWFTSNHDENSWNGSEYEKYGNMAKALAVFSCTWNGIPLIYSGQELPNLKRLKFFEKDAIEWRENCELHDFYKTLLNLHTNNPALRAGDPGTKTEKLTPSDNQHIFAFLRKDGEQQVLVILNFSCTSASFLLDSINGKFRDVFSFKEMEFSNKKSFQLNSWEYLVFERL
ncbi:MAG TPA: alpha-amylase family glycosyl hydrolase [Chitinophagaceae bacterium]|nr:alpha-amylase family glycosyl hydrolase [Chitinophagaceae bacterium]